MADPSGAVAPDDAAGSLAETALLAHVSEAEPVVATLRAIHDPAAALGVPAHVTILYPFVPAGRLTDALRRSLDELFARYPAFEVRFDRVERFDDGTVYLVPEPPDRFRALTDATHALFPEYPPYAGQYSDVVPHLTVGSGLADEVATSVEATVSAALSERGPVIVRISEILLMAAGSNGRWTVDGRHPLGTA